MVSTQPERFGFNNFDETFTVTALFSTLYFLGIMTKRRIIALNFSIKEREVTEINLILQAAA